MDIKIRYNTIVVEDMEESVRFYSEVLGFEVDSEFDLGPETAITLMKGQGDVMIELAKDTTHAVGFYSIGMDVDDIDKAIEDIASKGGKIMMGPVSITVGKLAFLEDPNGTRIALIEHN